MTNSSLASGVILVSDTLGGEITELTSCSGLAWDKTRGVNRLRHSEVMFSSLGVFITEGVVKSVSR